MSTQPEALRLADLLESCPLTVGDAQQAVAAAELRRLHEFEVSYGVMMTQAESRIAELLDALKAYGSHTGNCDYLMLLTSMPPQRKPCSCGLHAIIAKHGSGA
jgi:hypothetical protein